MKTATRRILLETLIGQTLAVSGCYNCARCLRKTMAECRVERSVHAGFVPGSKLVVRDNDGAINVCAGDEMDCHVTATAFIHAPTKREAAEIGEQLEIVAEQDAGGLLITVRKPPMPQEHRFVSVDLDIVVPRSAHVDCETTFGRVRLAGIAGDVTVSTQFGSITCEDIRGSLDLETQLGRITCREIVAEHFVASSQKGSIDVSCADTCPAELVAGVSTEWGKIRFKAQHNTGAPSRSRADGSVSGQDVKCEVTMRLLPARQGPAGSARARATCALQQLGSVAFEITCERKTGKAKGASMDTLCRNIRHGFRLLIRNPRVQPSHRVACGGRVGSSTAVFSIVKRSSSVPIQREPDSCLPFSAPPRERSGVFYSTTSIGAESPEHRKLGCYAFNSVPADVPAVTC
jgi:hypothetical protein